MDSPQELFAAMEVNGMRVEHARGMRVASLRYFDRGGKFAAVVRESVGRPMPEPLRADSVDGVSEDPRFILAWRSPTETLLLSTDEAAFAGLEERLAGEVDGCMVNQTGGLCALRVRGRTDDLLLRLGSSDSIPGVGEARASRMADLQALAVCVQAGTLFLLVERVYVAHLLDSIGRTAADFS